MKKKLDFKINILSKKDNLKINTKIVSVLLIYNL